jgi:hypothetical protein
MGEHRKGSMLAWEKVDKVQAGEWLISRLRDKASAV